MINLPKPLELPGLVAALAGKVEALTARVEVLEAQVAANTAELRRLRERADRGRRSGSPA